MYNVHTTFRTYKKKHMSMSSSSTNQSSSANQSWSNNSGWSSSVSQQQSFSNQGFGGFASAPMNKPPTMMQQQQQQQQQPQKPDLSAFDSLLSPSSSMINKQPMNAMRPTMTPQTSSLLQPQQSSVMNNNNNQGSKQLSMNDINDLLS